MSLPKHTAEHLLSGGVWSLPGDPDSVCEGARFHSPTPMFVQQVALVPRYYNERLSTFGPKADLCGVCRDNLDLLLLILHRGGGEVPWQVRREFGNDLRALAMRAWEYYAEHRTLADPEPDPAADADSAR